MGIGLGVIAGTALKLLAPRLASGAINAPRALPATASPLQALPQGLPLGRFEPHLELTGLSQAWARLAAVHKDLKASGFVLVLDDGRFAQMRSTDPMPAASSIKTPVLLAAMEDLDHGLLRWNEPLTLTKEVVGGGAGWIRMSASSTPEQVLRMSHTLRRTVCVVFGRHSAEMKLSTSAPWGSAGASSVPKRPSPSMSHL
jgi:beta-lactamase class A